jgi:tetratricopeptide (TPR) repeat protein
MQTLLCNNYFIIVLYQIQIIDVGHSYNGIGDVYINKAEYDKALEYYNKSLAIRIDKLGKDSTSVAASYNNIAIVYKNQQKYDEALEYYNKDFHCCIGNFIKSIIISPNSFSKHIQTC